MRFLVAVAGLPLLAVAEVHNLSLRSAVDLALRQNPDVLISRLNEQRAALGVNVARDPFVPKLFVGSGAAYTYGFPMSVEGSAPSVVQARGVASVFNKQQRLMVEATKADALTATRDGQARRDEVVFRVVEFYLDAERKGRLAAMADRQVDSARKLEQVVRARIDEGRELLVEARRAALEVARAEHRKLELQTDRDQAQAALATVLGLEPGDMARPFGDEDRAAPAMPASVEEAAQSALRENREIARMEADMAAKGIRVRAERAAKLPRLDLVAQYGLLARFNNYEDFFRRFQRHNAQIGVSVQVPVFAGRAADALAAQAETEVAKLRLEIARTRGRIHQETQRRYLEVNRAESARQLSRQALEVARADLDVQLARMDEGRAGVKQVEEARMEEHRKWIEYYDAQASLERARYALLDQTGALVAALR